MKIIFTAAEQTSFRTLNKKLADLIGTIPGYGDVAKAIKEKADTPIDFKSFARKINSEQVALSTDESGDLVLWINPETVEQAIELAVEQYSIAIEIACALYPVTRLAKRLFTGFAEKMETFAMRFVPKQNPLLGTTVSVVPADETQDVLNDCKVVAVHGDSIVVSFCPSHTYMASSYGVACLVGGTFVEKSKACDSLSDAIESTGVAITEWDISRGAI